MKTTKLTGFASMQAFRGWLLAVAMLPCVIRAQSNPTPDPQRPDLKPLNPHAKNIWVEGVGSGFRADVQSIDLSLGGYFGLAKCGSHEAHHMTLISSSYNHMLGTVQGADHWYRGNWGFRIELFGGAQFNPDVDWIMGLTPHLRYTFATGTRWIPFVDFGAGITGTGIGAPDLGSRFQFNEQAGVGIHWFVKNDIAVTFETLYMHISNAGISKPNCGVNGVKGLIGLTYFF
jgi:hypothetical protein